MAKRGRKPKRRSFGVSFKPTTIQSVFSILLILTAALITVSFFASEARLNSLIQKNITKVFGFGAILLPFLLFYFGLFLIRSLRWKILQTKFLLGFTTLFVLIVTALKSSGGVLGELLFTKVSGFISPAGTYISLFFGFLISVILMFEVNLNILAEKITSLFKNSKDKKVKENKNIELVKDIPKKEELKEAPWEKKKREEDFEIIPTKAEPKGTETAKASDFKKDTSSLPYQDVIWEYPPLSLLSDSQGAPADRGDVKHRASMIEKTLESFGIRARIVEVNEGPAVTQYALETAQGTKIARITSLQNDLALSLASPTGSVRIEAPIPGKSLIGVEVPNISPELVTLKQMLSSDIMLKAKHKLSVAIGNDVSGKPVISNIAKMPHVLIAGATGSGKSVMIHSIIATLLFRCSPQECKFIFIDPKRVELTGYKDIPHLLVPPITDVGRVPSAFKWTIAEMDKRYKLFENAKVRDIDAYNELSGFQALPYILIVVDELADLMMTAPVEIEKSICRLAQMARATGIHLILATQRPSVNVITGLIKANIPCRVSFNVTSQIDSRVIIDQPGAEKLLGRGDMLYVPPEASKPKRIQGVFVSDKERQALVDFLKKSDIKPEYQEEVLTTQAVSEILTGESNDDLFEQAVTIVFSAQKASASLLQRKLSIGYARAARIIDELEQKGVVSKAEGSKPREILIASPDEMLKNNEQKVSL